MLTWGLSRLYLSVAKERAERAAVRGAGRAVVGRRRRFRVVVARAVRAMVAVFDERVMNQCTKSWRDFRAAMMGGRTADRLNRSAHLFYLSLLFEQPRAMTPYSHNKTKPSI